MRYLLDTNICVYLIRHSPDSVLQRLKKLKTEDISISAITVAALQTEVNQSRFPDKNQEALNHFLLPLEVLPFGHLEAVQYGKIRADLEKKGTPVGHMDLLIASIAKQNNLILVTHNVAEFERVRGMEVEYWA